MQGLSSLYVTVKVPETMAAGDYPIEVVLISETGEEVAAAIVLTVLNAVLPPAVPDLYAVAPCRLYRERIRCRDFFGEALGVYRKLYGNAPPETGVNRHVDACFYAAARHGGGRPSVPTVQLVDVMRDAGGWHFRLPAAAPLALALRAVRDTVF